MGGARLVVSPQVPYDLRSRARNDAVGRAHGIRIAVLAYGGDGERRWGDVERGEVPAKGDVLRRCDLVVRCRGLRRLRDGEAACGCGRRDVNGRRA